jgi:hypothetical protein
MKEERTRSLWPIIGLTITTPEAYPRYHMKGCQPNLFGKVRYRFADANQNNNL